MIPCSPGQVFSRSKQIYDSAPGARSIASAIKTKELGSLKLALSHSFELALLIPHIKELKRLFPRLQLRLLRGSAIATDVDMTDLCEVAPTDRNTKIDFSFAVPRRDR